VFPQYHSQVWAAVWNAFAQPVDVSVAALSIGLTGWLLIAMLSGRARS
jgi:hypothetical protein